MRNSKHTLSPEIIEQIETITLTLKGNLLDEGTTRLFKSNIKAIAKRYTPQQSNLNFLVTEPENGIKFLNTFKVHTHKGYYNSIIQYLPISRLINKQEEAHKLYLKWLKPQEKVAKQYNPDDYKGYAWETIKPELEKIIKKEKDAVHKLLLALNTYIPPRRTQDYSYTKINQPYSYRRI